MGWLLSVQESKLVSRKCTGRLIPSLRSQRTKIWESGPSANLFHILCMLVYLYPCRESCSGLQLCQKALQCSEQRSELEPRCLSWSTTRLGWTTCKDRSSCWRTACHQNRCPSRSLHMHRCKLPKGKETESQCGPFWTIRLVLCGNHNIAPECCASQLHAWLPPHLLNDAKRMKHCHQSALGRFQYTHAARLRPSYLCRKSKSLLHSSTNPDSLCDSC